MQWALLLRLNLGSNTFGDNNKSRITTILCFMIIKVNPCVFLFFMLSVYFKVKPHPFFFLLMSKWQTFFLPSFIHYSVSIFYFLIELVFSNQSGLKKNAKLKFGEAVDNMGWGENLSRFRIILFTYFNIFSQVNNPYSICC